MNLYTARPDPPLVTASLIPMVAAMLLFGGLLLSGCEITSSSDDGGGGGSSDAGSGSGSGSDSDGGGGGAGTPDDYREAMRSFVEAISTQGKGDAPGFIIIPQNGADLATTDGEPDGPTADTYLAAIDGQGQEDLFYGYDEDDVATSADDTDWLLGFLAVQEAEGVEVLVTDYASTPANMDDSYTQNAADGFISFAADRRDLDNIPSYPSTPYNVHTGDVTSLADAANFLYILDPSNTDSFTDRADYLAQLAATNYDVFIIDAFYDDTILTAAEVDGLRTKANGGARLVIAYMSIGEAEDYRYYWDSSWDTDPPAWLDAENPDWAGNYKVHYWNADWQDVILDEDTGYLAKLLDAGFDGTYLDIIDAFEFFEE